MRESMGGAWLLQLMIVFILLFVAFLTVSINYTRAFRVKNEVLSFLEREEGLTNKATVANDFGGAYQLINNYLKLSGYKNKGACPIGENYKGITSLDVDNGNEYVEDGTKYYYCVKKTRTQKNNNQAAYYDVILFFDFNLPVFGNITTYSVVGTTSVITNPADADMWR